MKYPPTWIFSLINYFTLETYQPYILNKITHTKKYSYQHYIFNRIPTTPKKYSYQPYILIKITQKKKKKLFISTLYLEQDNLHKNNPKIFISTLHFEQDNSPYQKRVTNSKTWPNLTSMASDKELPSKKKAAACRNLCRPKRANAFFSAAFLQRSSLKLLWKKSLIFLSLTDL